MTDEQHYLVILAEECAEVAQCAIKAVRFGFDGVKPGQELTNKQRLENELGDLLCMVEMLNLTPHDCGKKSAVEKYMEISRQKGQL